jgi:hypothetical protein
MLNNLQVVYLAECGLDPKVLVNCLFFSSKSSNEVSGCAVIGEENAQAPIQSSNSSGLLQPARRAGCYLGKILAKRPCPDTSATELSAAPAPSSSVFDFSRQRPILRVSWQMSTRNSLVMPLAFVLLFLLLGSGELFLMSFPSRPFFAAKHRWLRLCLVVSAAALCRVVLYINFY